MRPSPLPDPDPAVAAMISRRFRGKRRKPLPVEIRDRLGTWLRDEDFAAAFGARGRPGRSPAMLSLVSVLQAQEELSDRQTGDMLATRLDWQYLLGLGPDDDVFDFSVLCEFRKRVADNGLEKTVLDALLARLRDEGLVRAGGKQRTDSTWVLSAARHWNTTELVAESVRAALEALSVACPGWTGSRLHTGDWERRYALRTGSWSSPPHPGTKGEAALQYARDGRALVAACCEDSAPPFARDLDAVQVLRTVLLQNFLMTWDEAAGREVLARREAGSETGLPPAERRIVSPYDTAARRGARDGGFLWLGHKLHVTDTCDDPPDGARPLNIITGVETAGATVTDVEMTMPVTRSLAGRGLAPAAHYADSGYASAGNILASARDHGVTLITPLPADYSRQAREGKGYDRSKFAIDYDARTATCPQGHRSTGWSETSGNGKPQVCVRFNAATCRACPVRADCTSGSRGRSLTLLPRELHEITLAARAAERDPEWRQDYKRRAGSESTVSQFVAAGARRTRYHDPGKIRLRHNLLAVAINFRRLNAYWNDSPFDRDRTTHFARLCQELRLAALPAGN